jgi:hypothetical protein
MLTAMVWIFFLLYAWKHLTPTLSPRRRRNRYLAMTTSLSIA